MKKYTNEELITRIEEGSEDALEQLFRNLRPIILHEAETYRDKMTTYDMDDLIQEGNILAWEIIVKGNFKTGKFSTYYTSAIKNRLTNIYRDYTLKNLVCIGEHEDCRGNVTSILVESDYAKNYREKHRAQCKAWYEKKKAAQPPKEPKPRQTKEEKAAKAKAYQKEYYAAHPEKLEERRAKARAYQKAKYEAQKAARMAATA
ncbi:MAG: sigma-70 family RNA polymerase sigma factor [Oscillospiraceae bacterium]|nr:sigma-70 family RNA polymerase sigma factor [Oscillospiraceae bacterium]